MKATESIRILKEKTRTIPDYPKPGILFRDLTTVFQDPEAFALSLDLLADALGNHGNKVKGFDKLAGIEARGFLLAGALAGKLGGGVVMIRKPGKLPFKKLRVDYQLEYGQDGLEIHEDAILPGEKIVIVDDLLATGGTAEAGCKLVEKLGGIVEKIIFLVELPALNGRARLSNYEVESIISFEGA
jgi:adenine phosphoribosyltransferase